MKNIAKSTPIVLAIIAASCAQIVAPTGGQADKEPPVLLSSYPENKTLNYTSREFTFTFDELVDASSLQNELFIVPDPGSPYEVKVKNNVVTLKFEKNLSENTTYTFNFRNGIKDLTERNPAKNLKLVVSTGNQIDSLQLEGTVLDMFTKQPRLDVTIGLYPQDTIPFSKKRPLYFVKTDSSGKYLLENVKNNKYFLLAFTDKNNNLRYDQKEEAVAFLTDSLDLQENIALPALEIYKADHSRNRIKRALSRENEFVLQLDKSALKAAVSYQQPSDSQFVAHRIDNTSLTFYKMQESVPDTLYTTLVLTDSLLVTDTLQQKVYFREGGRKRKQQTLSIASNIRSGQELTSPVEYRLTFPTPLVRLDTAKITLLTDTLETDKKTIEVIDKQIVIVKYNAKSEREISLVIPPNTFEDYLGDTTGQFTLKNPILKEDQVGLLEGETADKETPKIAILQNEQRTQEIARQPFINRFLFEKVIPGNYHITVIYDTNQNGIWDPGNLDKRTQPERITTTQEPLRVRANYEFRSLKLE